MMMAPALDVLQKAQQSISWASETPRQGLRDKTSVGMKIALEPAILQCAHARKAPMLSLSASR